MKIFIFSDWQEQPIKPVFNCIKREKPLDAVVYSGDNLNRFYKEGNNKLEELAEETRLGKTLAVKGNTDESNPKVFTSEKVHNLHNETFQHESISFLGLNMDANPIIKNPNKEIDDHFNHLKKQYNESNAETSVLISHQPPNRILDIASKLNHRHIGSQDVRKFIEQEKIDLTVCGHCHQFGGRAKEKNFGTVINIASPENPKVQGRYGIVEIRKNGKISYNLKTTKKGVDHELLELTQVGENRLKHFQEENITELNDIREESRDKLEELPGVYHWHVDTWIKEKEAIVNGDIAFTNEDKFEFLNSENLVLFDIETKLGGGKTWLIGLYSYKEDEFAQIFEKDDEEKLLKQFIEYIDTHDNPKLVYYSNCKFDEETLRARMIENSLESDIVALDNSVDLGIKVQNHLLGGFLKSNLKDVSEYLTDYNFTYENLDGFDVGNMYSRYLLDDKEPNWNKLMKYNKDDVISMKNVVDYLKEKYLTVAKQP